MSEQSDWVAELGDPPYKRRVTFDHIVVDPGQPEDPMRPQITVTRTEGRVTEIDLMPPKGHAFAICVTATGSVHIALRRKSE